MRKPCTNCGRGHLAKTRMCARCRRLARERQRRMKGTKPWQRGKPGRPPAVLERKRAVA